MFRAARFRDVHLYGAYADALLDGNVPYRDFFVEYPPGAFPVFVPPALADAAHYNFLFKALMALCGLATIFFLVLVLCSLGAGNRRLYGAVLVVALAPGALGPISLNTYDAWPALLTVAALAALLRSRDVVAFGLLGLAVAAKVYPLVLVPLACAFVWQRSGARGVLRAVATCLAALAVVVGPFALAAPSGLFSSFEAQAARALQVESLGAAVLLAAHRLGLYSARVVEGSTAAVSRDLEGSLPDALAVASSVLQGLAVALVWLLYARGPRNAERLAVAFAAAAVGFLGFTRFFSPQYLVWLVPLVPLVPGLAGAIACGLLLMAMVLAQLWFFDYAELFRLTGIVWLVVARDAVLVAVYAVLLGFLVRGRRAAGPARLKTSTPSS